MLFAIVSLLCSLPAAQTPALESGRQLFASRCGACHGADGRGGERGPGITNRGLRSRDRASLSDLVRNGLPARGMPGVNLPAAEMDAMIVFLRTLDGAAPTVTRKIPVNGPAFSTIASPGRGDWLSYHGQLSGNRYSALDQIHTGNAGALAPRWIFGIPGAGRLQVTPIVVDGVMYITAVNEARALDAATGREIWSFRRPRTQGLVGDAAGGINRGVALLNDRVFLVTDHAHLLALDRATGALLWDTEMADYRQNYGATAAPLVVNDLVLSGTSGGDEGVRGFIAAYSASTGKEIWRFWTVPAPGEPAASTWQGVELPHGCAAAWLTGVYDPQLKLVYWPTGNPCPDYNGDERKGDNLYASSVVALDAVTGKLRWHYQFTPHDLHDWDATQVPVLIDADWGGRARKLLVQANRNGFFYVLDRTDGKLLLAKPFVEKMNWAKGIGVDGRPIAIPEANPTAEGVRACPAVEGATNWMAPSFHPSTGFYYIMALEKCTIYRKAPAQWEAGKSHYGGATRRVPDEPGKKYLRALDLRTGRIVWELPQEGPAESWGGTLATQGGLVFFGHDNGDFAAADAKTGRLLWSFPANALWKASPMTYLAGGKQYVAIAAGGAVVAFGLP
ncbi:MAG: PQQ-dependent dehydrogenase, methanol/ethanol family [Bryobacterales bacterium]|nr:PQQ-dependent dehydrogenase, methanol/ethanol family [Bryobacterales bacterium]